MDPAVRLVLEHSFEAVIDAGINPRSLKGSNISVYTATNLSESEKSLFNHITEVIYLYLHHNFLSRNINKMIIITDCFQLKSHYKFKNYIKIKYF